MMTRDEMHADIGKAFQERKELSQKIKCLENRLKTTGNAATLLSDNPYGINSIDATQWKQWNQLLIFEKKQLRDSLIRLKELNKILSDHATISLNSMGLVFMIRLMVSLKMWGLLRLLKNSSSRR